MRDVTCDIKIMCKHNREETTRTEEREWQRKKLSILQAQSVITGKSTEVIDPWLYIVPHSINFQNFNS